MIDRRSFLKESLAVVALGLGVPSVFSKAAAASAAENSRFAANGRTLIVVQLAGGVDTLNTVIPYADPAYRQNRPTVGIPNNEMLRIDDRVAFHPAMGEMKQLLDAGQLAVVEGVGYPKPDFSHFRSMDIWQTADPAGVGSKGWLGKYFDGMVDAEGHPLSGLSIGRSLPSSLKSAKASIPSMETLETFGLTPAYNDADSSPRRTSLLKMYDIYRPANTPFAALLDSTMDSAMGSAEDLAAAHAGYAPAVTYPNSPLSSGLRLLAELIHWGGNDMSPLRVGHVSLGGFDTHTGETARLNQLLGDTSEALSAFWQDVSAHGHGDEVVVMTWTEFGRRVRENAQDGTDHGSAGSMFILGNQVRGGFYGEPPSLTNLDNGNMRFTTDFRQVYATMLDRWMEAPADEILGSHFDAINLLKV